MPMGSFFLRRCWEKGWFIVWQLFFFQTFANWPSLTVGFCGWSGRVAYLFFFFSTCQIAMEVFCEIWGASLYERGGARAVSLCWAGLLSLGLFASQDTTWKPELAWDTHFRNQQRCPRVVRRSRCETMWRPLSVLSPPGKVMLVCF